MIARNNAFEAPATSHRLSLLSVKFDKSDVPFAWKLHLLFLYSAKSCSLDRAQIKGHLLHETLQGPATFPSTSSPPFPQVLTESTVSHSHITHPVASVLFCMCLSSPGDYQLFENRSRVVSTTSSTHSSIEEGV